MKHYNYKMLSMPYANAHVEFITDNFGCLANVRLCSYSTLMLDLALNRSTPNGTLEVKYPVNCSNTTARHVNCFTSELFGENKYHELKKLATGDQIDCEDILMNAVDMFERYAINAKRHY